MQFPVGFDLAPVTASARLPGIEYARTPCRGRSNGLTLRFLAQGCSDLYATHDAATPNRMS